MEAILWFILVFAIFALFNALSSYPILCIIIVIALVVLIIYVKTHKVVKVKHSYDDVHIYKEEKLEVKHIEPEAIKITCPYCRNKINRKLDTCPFCGGHIE